MSDLHPGVIIKDRYEILSEIGRGGMGVVYKARHLLLNEEKALKVLTDTTEAAQRALMAEAQVMVHLKHPNIVRVEDADYTEDNRPFVVMEYVVGESLRDRLKRLGPITPESALGFTVQVCEALTAAHQRGIIHRDIKPQNLLLTKRLGRTEAVKVIDFGIAKVREEAGLGFTGVLENTTGLYVGTPWYASPEQAMGMHGRELDGRTDLYSLGLVLYEMLTGRLPFAGGGTSQAVLVRRVIEAPLPLEEALPGASFPPKLASLAMKTLEKERTARWASAEQMRHALLALLDEWRAQRERQNYEAAVLSDIQMLDEAIQLSPLIAYVLYTARGAGYNGLGQYQRAIQDYDKAIQLKPDYAAAYHDRADAKDKLGDIAGANADRARAKELGYKPQPL